MFIWQTWFKKTRTFRERKKLTPWSSGCLCKQVEAVKFDVFISCWTSKIRKFKFVSWKFEVSCFIFESILHVWIVWGFLNVQFLQFVKLLLDFCMICWIEIWLLSILILFIYYAYVDIYIYIYCEKHSIYIYIQLYLYISYIKYQISNNLYHISYILYPISYINYHISYFIL